MLEDIFTEQITNAQLTRLVFDKVVWKNSVNAEPIQGNLNWAHLTAVFLLLHKEREADLESEVAAPTCGHSCMEVTSYSISTDWK